MWAPSTELLLLSALFGGCQRAADLGPIVGRSSLGDIEGPDLLVSAEQDTGAVIRPPNDTGKLALWLSIDDLCSGTRGVDDDQRAFPIRRIAGD